MATIKYYINVPDKDGNRSVSLIISHDFTKKMVSTGIRLLPNEFTKSGKPKNKNILWKKA